MTNPAYAMPITFVEEHTVKVYVGNRHVGTIRKEEAASGAMGYRYYPRSKKVGGLLHSTLTRCKAEITG